MILITIRFYSKDQISRGCFQHHFKQDNHNLSQVFTFGSIKS